MDPEQVRERIMEHVAAIEEILGDVRDHTLSPVVVFTLELVHTGRVQLREAHVKIIPPAPIIERLTAEILDRNEQED